MLRYAVLLCYAMIRHAALLIFAPFAFFADILSTVTMQPPASTRDARAAHAALRVCAAAIYVADYYYAVVLRRLFATLMLPLICCCRVFARLRAPCRIVDDALLYAEAIDDAFTCCYAITPRRVDTAMKCYFDIYVAPRFCCFIHIDAYACFFAMPSTTRIMPPC